MAIFLSGIACDSDRRRRRCLLRRKEIHDARLFSAQIFVLDVRSLVGRWFQGVQINGTQVTVVTPTASIDRHIRANILRYLCHGVDTYNLPILI